MSSRVTSYVNLFSQLDDTAAVQRIEIPLIQRDYAQGRETPGIADIRADFLDVLLEAVSGGTPVGLDFVYGDVRDGTLRPLDGQQRLTTLFLLHWYVAFRTGRLDDGLPWTHFSYATRASARLFCERLVRHAPPATIGTPSSWIKDQPWYLHIWRHDPTIRSMLVMVDAVNHRFQDIDLEAAWMRLTDEAHPAISFHLLPIEEMGAGDELYIKMNSRGKPLTPFENFKARFERALEGSPRAGEFAELVDGAWSDVFWAYRGSDDIVDDKLIRYFTFVTQVTEWRAGAQRSGRLEARAQSAFAGPGRAAEQNLGFLFDAFNAWRGLDIADFFTGLLTPATHREPGRIPLFGSRPIDHFRSCCESYRFDGSRQFGWAEILTLYAAIIHRIHATREFPRRLRVLRNLLEASGNELRLDNMPALVTEVEHLILGETHGEALDGLSTFNEAQIEDERQKAAFLSAHPELTKAVFELEDHRLLRGSLVAFELDADRFEARATCFAKLMDDQALWLDLTAALLVTGDYWRRRNARSFRFGSPDADLWWRDLLTGTSRSNLAPTSAALAQLLDIVTDESGQEIDTLRRIRTEWISAQTRFDWRYYFVAYDSMREGKSGIYVAEGGNLGFRLCMLDQTQLNSWYRDPFLLAIWRNLADQGPVISTFFMGYETSPRWMSLRASGTALRCIDAGFLLRPPDDANHRTAFDQVCQAAGIGRDHLLRIPQHMHDGKPWDEEDRVQRGAALITDLVAAGL